MKEIGGFPELEVANNSSLYDDMIALNSGRNSLVYLLSIKGVDCLQLPYYNCRVIADTIAKCFPELNIKYYHLDSDFQPILDTKASDSALYIVNYYGFLDDTIYGMKDADLIVDNAQAFYSPPVPGVDTIYSPRKFLGVADGAYLKTDAANGIKLEYDISWERMVHLLKRIDLSGSDAYLDFRSAESSLAGLPVRKMSRLTRRILSGVDHECVKDSREE